MAKFGKKKTWQKQTLRMQDNHTWRAPDGYKIVVLDRGLVSFNIPRDWVVGEKTEPFEMYDRAEPDDNARLSVSYWRLPPGVDWTGLPLTKLLDDATKEEKENVLERGEIAKVDRDDLEMVWMEQRFQDTKEPREAFSRFTVARDWNVAVLFTIDYWVDDAQKMRPVWAEIVRSLQLGRYIEDPTKGITLQ
jgi:hypothetical protein